MALDPVLQQILNQIPLPPAGEVDIAALRSSAPDLLPILYGPGGPVEVAEVENVELQGAGGPVPIRIFRPFGSPRGTLHFIHGGAWSLGGIDFIEPIARRLARDASMVVATSGYRLAPENPFPAGFDDSLAAARWVLDRTGELGGAGRPVVIGGESAGANLAAAIALALRDEPLRRNFDAQLLFFPAVDLREGAGDYPSRRANADPTLPTETFPQLFSSYGGGHDPADPRISPAAAESLRGAPPAVIVVLTVDPLRDEGVAYAEALRQAGTLVELIEFRHLTHGFLGFAALVPAAAEAASAATQALETLLAQVAVAAA
jgi:acetyl esterase/lipase